METVTTAAWERLYAQARSLGPVIGLKLGGALIFAAYLAPDARLWLITAAVITAVAWVVGFPWWCWHCLRQAQTSATGPTLPGPAPRGDSGGGPSPRRPSATHSGP